MAKMKNKYGTKTPIPSNDNVMKYGVENWQNQTTLESSWRMLAAGEQHSTNESLFSQKRQSQVDSEVYTPQNHESTMYDIIIDRAPADEIGNV